MGREPHPFSLSQKKHLMPAEFYDHDGKIFLRCPAGGGGGRDNDVTSEWHGPATMTDIGQHPTEYGAYLKRKAETPQPSIEANSSSMSPSAIIGRPNIDVTLNTSYETIYENIRVNSLRPLHWLHRHETKTETALIVGSGPSLVDDVELIRKFKLKGAVIVAINGAAAYLADRAIEVDWHLLLDARESNIKFLQPLRANRVLLASQCDPSLFDAVLSDRIILFHSLLPGLAKFLPGKTDYVAFPGGITSGLTALCVVSSGMGYRDVHLFGYDSSDRDGMSRPFVQDENAAEQERIDVVCAGRRFSCSLTMYRQATDFSQWADLVKNEGVALTLHGDGLLPTIVRERAKPPDNDAAIYDLNAAPASWDFLPWLANAVMAARSRGVTRLRVSFMPGRNLGFRDDGLPLSVAERTGMLDGVIRPALDLFGAVEDPAIERGHGHDYMLAPICAASRAGVAVPRIMPPHWASKEIDGFLGGRDQPVTITLREASHWSSRNSNLEAWLDFAEELERQGENVVIVRDTERAIEKLRGFITCPRASLDLKVRAALYERAKVNCFVANGPIALAYFGTCPFLIFKPLVEGYGPASAMWWSEKIGVPTGTQYPWARDDQRIVWADDTFGNITKAWNELLPQLARRSRAA